MTSNVFTSLNRWITDFIIPSAPNAGSDEQHNPYGVFYHPTSPRNVFEVRDILSDFLPLELVLVILNEAHYWVYQSSMKSAQISVGAKPSNHNNASQCYLVTAPLAEEFDENVAFKVKYIVFELDSHDQGWGGNTEDRGTYNGSWTWFEAAIIRDNHEVLSERDPESDSSRWFVQANIVASPTRRQHIISWPPFNGEGSEGVGESHRPRKHQFKGRINAGTEFVSLLRRHDKIAVFARAMFPQWANRVYGVKVHIFYDIL